jgi:hypothetical protein
MDVIAGRAVDRNHKKYLKAVRLTQQLNDR